MMFFDFVDKYSRQPKKLPKDYTVYQKFVPRNIELKPILEVLGEQSGEENQSFAILENVTCVLCRRGCADWEFSTAIRA